MSAINRRAQRCAPSRRTRAIMPASAGVEGLEARLLLTLSGQQLFPSDNPWNQVVGAAPVASNSTAIIANIIKLQGSDGRLHPDFGQSTGTPNVLYGIPYNVVHGNALPKVSVVIDAYPGESDIQAAPIPANPIIEGDLQNGPRPGVNNRGDSHLIVYDVDNNVAYEFYRASRPSENADGKWHADQESVWNLNTDSFRPQDWTSADAAGLPILPGLVRPDEALPVSQGGQGAIDHAIRFTLRNNVILNQYLFPAEHVANPGNTNAAIEPPMGTRFRLKAGVDISKLSPESQAIAQAMKTYGMILADNGSNFFFSGASTSTLADGTTLTWNDNDIQSSTTGLKSLHFSDFEVVNLTPAVTGLGNTTAAAGSTISIVGQNFSGAAGKLSVLFGGVAATNVVVVDDAHLTATVPAGSGTVDVRVQSGATTPNHSENVKGTIFGYGLSTVTSGDRFTYSGTVPTNHPPVANPDTATTPAGTSVKVAVLANDTDPDNDPLSIASITQPVNGLATINADKTVTYTPKAGFSGKDTFSYVASDGRGGTATAQVTITVSPPTNPPPTPFKAIVNVDDPGYSETGRLWQDGPVKDPSGHRNRISFRTSTQTTLNTANWTVSGLASGTYQVFTTWVANPSLANNAPYRIFDGSTSRGTVRLNQRLNPTGVTDGGRVWQLLGTYTITGGTIKVHLSDDSTNGHVNADAIRIVATTQSTPHGPTVKKAAVVVGHHSHALKF